jgi:hypothetical protein
MLPVFRLAAKTGSCVTNRSRLTAQASTGRHHGHAAEQRYKFTTVQRIELHPLSLATGGIPVWRGSNYGPAALRDFNLAHVSSGSKASDRRARRLRGMSAVPLIATELVTRGIPSLGANNGLPQCSKSHLYSMTSSASAINLSGTSRPSIFAVLRFMIISNLVGNSTGKSAGLSPLRIRPA